MLSDLFKATPLSTSNFLLLLYVMMIIISAPKVNREESCTNRKHEVSRGGGREVASAENQRIPLLPNIKKNLPPPLPFIKLYL
jgi:hypothetical protein